jgi:ATP/maltotriose-dependent transcriptional regulator MalT
MTADPVLTEREKEILHLIYQGKSNMEIAAALSINTLTVKDHVRKILRKLKVHNRTQAVGRAVALRIVTLPEAPQPPSSKRPSTLHH